MRSQLSVPTAFGSTFALAAVALLGLSGVACSNSDTGGGSLKQAGEQVKDVFKG